MRCERCGHNPDARVTASWSFFLDKEPRGLNARLVNGGTRWQQAAYRRERNEWLQWMRLARVNQRIPIATAKRRVRLVRQYTGRQRPFDVDGYIGGLKSAVDAMVQAALIVDDDKRWAEIEYVQRKGGPNERSGLWVIVEEIEESEEN